MSDARSDSLDGELLHRLHDGELDATERAAVEARLDDVARARLRALAEVGEALRNTVSAEVEGAGALDLWPGIEAQLRPAKVLPFHRRLLRGRMPVWISTVAAAAAALAALLFSAGKPGVPTNGCDIESLEVSGAAVTVLKMEDVPGHSPATVVWLQEE
jgi:anti-sigma factor RsiW